MIRRAVFLLAGILFAFISQAKEIVRVAPVPAWVQEVSYNTKLKVNTDDISDGYLYTLLDQQMHAGKQTYFYHYSRKILTRQGVQYGSEISVNYDPTYQKLHFHYISIHRNGQKLNKLEPQKIKLMQRETSRERFIYDGSYTAILTLEDVREGDVIDYAYSIEGDNPIFENQFSASFSLQFHDPLDQLFVRVLMPASRNVQVKGYGSKIDPAINITPEIKHEAGLKIYTWQLKQVPGLTSDDNIPFWYEPYPFVWVSEYSSWKQVNDWALKLFAFPSEKSKALQLQIDSIKNEYGADTERLVAAIKFVQNDIRYLGIESGISSHKPFPPAQVFNQRYGDCKDKANLLCYMLGEMGIKAYPALVNTRSREGIKDWLPNPNMFDHCVAQVQLLGKTIWVDATSSNQEGPYDNIYFPDYGYALVVGPQTKGLTKIDANNASKFVIEENYLLDMEEKGAELSVTTNHFGYEADKNRDYFASTSNADIAKNYLNFYAGFFPNIKEKEVLLSYENRATKSFVVNEQYTIDDLWEVSAQNEEEKITTFYPQIIHSKIAVPSTKIRTMPYALEYPMNYEQVITVHPTALGTVEMEDLTIEENGIFFSKKVTYTNNVLTQKYIYRTTKPFIETADINAFIATQNKVKNELGYTITKYNGISTSTASGNNFNTLFLWFMLAGLVLGGFVAYKIYHYDPIPDPDHSRHPLNIGSWLVVVSIGLCLTPFRLLVQVLSADYFNLETWNRLGDTGSSFYNPGMQALLVGEFCYNAAYFVTVLVLIYLFFKRRSNVPKLMVGFYLLNIIVQVAEAVLMKYLNLPVDDVFTDLGSGVVAGAIWIPYFMLSGRVKQTFVNMLNPVPLENEPVETFAERGWQEEELV